LAEPGRLLRGSSAEAGQVAARFADTYLTWGEPPAQVGEKLDWIRGLAKAQGWELSYGIRLHVISRDTSERAWSEAQRLLSALSPQTVAAAQASLARSESEGQHRMRELHNGGGDFGGGADARRLEIYPNLWSGVGLVRGGAGTALVGSHQEVADRIAEYAELGLDHFILSGYPHLEEVYIFGEGVRPILARRGLLGDGAELARSNEPVHSASCRTSETSVLLDATSRSITGAAPPERGCDGHAQPTMSPSAARAGAAIEAHGVAGQPLCIGPADVLWSSCDCSDR